MQLPARTYKGECCISRKQRVVVGANERGCLSGGPGRRWQAGGRTPASPQDRRSHIMLRSARLRLSSQARLRPSTPGPCPRLQMGEFQSLVQIQYPTSLLGWCHVRPDKAPLCASTKLTLHTFCFALRVLAPNAPFNVDHSGCRKFHTPPACVPTLKGRLQCKRPEPLL